MSIVHYATATNCNACCQDVSVNLAVNCKTRGGTASLCGYSEYTDPSTPPKKYRKRTLSGTAVGRIFDTAGCSDLNCTATDTWSGDCTYDSENCAIVENGTFVRSATGGDCGTGFSSPACDIGDPFFGDSEVLTATTRQIISDLACYAIAGGKYFRRPSQSSRTETLSVEDTDDDAITRLLASANFSNYVAAVNCVSSECCLAEYEQRTTEFNFTYTEANYQMTLSNLSPESEYCVIVDIWRAPYGSANYAPFETREYSVTTDANGFWEDYDEILPDGPGFQWILYNFKAYVGDCP